VPPGIKLLPLTESERLGFAELQVDESRASMSTRASGRKPRRRPLRAECRELIADLLRDAGYLFFKGVDSRGTRVGWLWVAPAPAMLKAYDEHDLSALRWLSQITVPETMRRQGYGLALLQVLHDRLAAESVVAIYPRVYDWNEAALRLYTRCGYELVREFATDAHMRKRLRS
jgi:GNAT superfamily N-acetyltransferase